MNSVHRRPPSRVGNPHPGFAQRIAPDHEHATENAAIELGGTLRALTEEALATLDDALQQAIVANDRSAVEHLRALREQTRLIMAGNALAEQSEAALLADVSDPQEREQRLAQRAVSLGSTGRVDDALAAMTTVLACAEAVGGAGLRVGVMRLHVQLLAVAGRESEAQTALVAAREVARPLGSHAQAALDELERSLTQTNRKPRP